jgi:hypothetical protein
MSDTQVAERGAQVQRPTRKPESAGGKVTVYCRLPTGLDIRGFRMVKQHELVMGGGTREFMIAEPVGLPVHLNGNAFFKGEPQTHRVICGYGVTEGVDKDLWDNWLEANRDQPYVANKLVFAAERKDIGEDEAEENRDRLSGLEPMYRSIDPDGKDRDPRAPRPTSNLRGIRNFDRGN